MPEPSGAARGLPVDRILQMRQQGYSDNQIVQILQTDGYKSHQIFDAMNQADMRSAGEQPEMQESAPMPQMPSPPPMRQPPPMQAMPESAPTIDEEKIEEIAEAIIEEKWEDLVKNVNKIIDWKEATDSRIAKIEEDFSNLKSGFDTLHTAILGKVGEYEERMTGVSTELKALENVFKKILPTLTENVNELSRITSDLKKKK